MQSDLSAKEKLIKIVPQILPVTLFTFFSVSFPHNTHNLLATI